MAKLALIAHNIRSTENVGSLLRTADSLGVSSVWLTGYTPKIDHPKVKKTALGAEQAIETIQRVDIDQALTELKQQGFEIVGLEIDPKSELLQDFKPTKSDLALLLGNEVEGIAPHLRDKCDCLVYIKQNGIKESMNVAVAAGIACYELMLKLE